MDATANHTMIQGSAEWHAIRLGKFTSSEIYRLMSEPKLKAEKEAGELSDGAKTYVLEKVHETLTGEQSPAFDSMATVWGVQNEPIARAWYERINNVQVQQLGFTEASPSYGGSTDGLVGEDGGIEIKCPFNGSNHLEHCLIDGLPYMKQYFKDHYWQCVSNMLLNGRAWWDFISFDPRLNYDSGFFQFRIVPPQEDIDLLAKKVAQAVEFKMSLLEKFTSIKTL